MRVACDRAPDVGEQHGPRRGEQARVHLGLALEDVEPGREESALARARRRAPPRRRPDRARCSRAPRSGFMSASRRASIEVAGRVGERARAARRCRTRASSSSRSRGPARASPVSWRVWCSTCMPKPLARRATACPMRPKPTRPSVAPCTSRPRYCVDPPARASDRRAGRPRRRTRAGTPRGSAGTRGRPWSRRARPACCTPRRRARVGRGDVDVVVADRDVGDDPQPAARPASSTARVDPVGQQADDRVDRRRRSRDELVVRVAACRRRAATSSCPAASSGSSPPSGSRRVTRTRATARSVLGVVDRAGVPRRRPRSRSSGSARGRSPAAGCARGSGGMCTRSPCLISRSSPSIVMSPRPEVT